MGVGDCGPSDWQRSVWGFPRFFNNTYPCRYATPLAPSCRQDEHKLLDYSKALDLIDHNILVKTLYSYDVPNILVHWIGSFMSDRRQHVQIGHELPDWLYLFIYLFIYINIFIEDNKFSKAVY